MRAVALIVALAALPAAALEDRARAELERQGLGADALLLIDNLLRHGSRPPPAAAPLVRELLARPLEAANAETLFARAVPRALFELVNRAQAEAKDDPLAVYLEELAEAERLLRIAVAGHPLPELPQGRPSPDELIAIAKAADLQGIERASQRFLEATARFVGTLDEETYATGKIFDAAIGKVVIGTRGDDRHPADAALIVDPAGDDVYERAPARGSVRVVVDLRGNDRYEGVDIALGGFSAIVDLRGDDRYTSKGAGIGAAIAGAAVVLDVAGDDRYEAGMFAQGAAAFGLGALVDVEGDDAYRVHAWGQGFAMAGGTGLVWDREGDDRYAAAGEPDFYERGGGRSGAQGAAFGVRTALGGGIGVLRDERGDDRYDAEMFAQGSGFYSGIGLLWDGGGDDHYRAVRYAQGNGAHEAVGALRDESGRDRYELALGVGQGMGLDLSVGALFDGGGDDVYRARFFAQGTATGNGLGLFYDPAGADELSVGHAGSWGVAEPMRGLPSVGLFLHHSHAPRSGALPVPAESGSCEKDANLEKRIEQLHPERFVELVAVGAALACALKDGEHWDTAERLLREDPATPLAGWIAGMLEHAAAEKRAEILDLLKADPRCGVHALALESVPRLDAARAALGSECWRLQAAGLAALERLGAEWKPPPSSGVSLPSFLRRRRAY